MPKVVKPLSALAVSRLTRPGLHAVGTVPGLCLDVGATGSRSWIYRTVVGTRRRSIGLGPYPAVPLAAAIEKARAMREEREQGVDPIEAKRARRSTLLAAQAAERTFMECAAAYIKAHEKGWKNAKHAAQWRATLETYAEPVVGRMLVRDVALPHVLAILEPIWTTKTETATRVRSRVELVLDWAIARNFRQGPNPARWRGNLDKMLPKARKVTKVQHHPAIPVDGLGAFMARLRKQEGIAARALEFAVLTACRSGEVRGALWSEIDLRKQVWTIPAARMKAEEEHRVPLSAQALKLLKAMPRIAGVDTVFFSSRHGPLSDMALTAVMRRMGETAVPHGFRSTFKDWASERTNFPNEVSEAALAHTIKSATEAAYRRGDLFAKRAKLMQAWGDYCAAPASTGKVIAMKNRAAR